MIALQRTGTDLAQTGSALNKGLSLHKCAVINLKFAVIKCKLCSDKM